MDLFNTPKLSFTTPKHLLIVGCGTVGAALVFKLCLHEIENPTLSKIFIIDFDYLEPKNFPYCGCFKKEDNVGKTKVSVCRHLTRTNENLYLVEASYGRYPNPAINNLIPKDTMIIDCRDEDDIFQNCSMKINIDGSYGRIRIFPEVSTSDQTRPVGQSKYQLGCDKYYADILTSIVVSLIFEPDAFSERIKSDNIINLKNGKVIENEHV
jgi:hypothetical protein